jgi:pimeloyl-ACP methyl ester carboxylesterase
MSHWSSGNVIANGIRIHYHRTGGDKPPLVVSHGFSDNGLCWTRVTQALKQDYDVVMPDARGHGLSEAPEGAYTARAHAADLAGLIQALDLGKPALMGHSMGAATTATTAVLYPDLVACAILEDPPWFAPDSPRASASPEERQAHTQARFARIRGFKEMTHEQIVRAGHGEREHPTWDEIEFGPWADAKMQMSLNVLHGSQGRGIQELRGRWQDIAPQIQCPALLVTADPELGAIITPQVAQQVAQMNSHIQLVRIEKAGHNIRREQFEPFVQAVTEFLAQFYRT